MKAKLQEEKNYADEYKQEAESIRNSAIEQAMNQNIKSEMSSGWPLRQLIRDGDMDIENYVRGYSTMYQFLSEEITDAKAYWVDQREVGFIEEEEINQKIKLGTNNVHQCVVLMINGTDAEGRKLAALAHVDKYTMSQSIESVFDRFSQKDQIIIYGGSDLGEQKKVTEDNIKIVREVVERKNPHNPVIDMTGREDLSPEIVFDPLTNNVEQGVTPLRGVETTEIRLMKRRLENKSKEHDIRDPRVAVERDSELDKINLEDCDSIERFNKNQLSEDLAKQSLIVYCANYEKELKSLDSYRGKEMDLAEYCRRNFEPFIEMTYQAQLKLGHNINKKELYNGKVLELQVLDEYKIKQQQEFELQRRPSLQTQQQNIEHTQISHNTYQVSLDQFMQRAYLPDSDQQQSQQQSNRRPIPSRLPQSAQREFESIQQVTDSNRGSRGEQTTPKHSSISEKERRQK